MGSKLRMGILVVLSLIYAVLVTVLWKDGALVHHQEIPRYAIHGTSKTTHVTDHVNTSLVHGPVQSPKTSTVDFGAPDKQRCLWKVQFWNYPYQPSLREQLEGSYYCLESQCTVKYTHSSSYDAMNSSHVVVLHHIGTWDIKKINSARRTDQIIAYMTWENPLISIRVSDLGDFDWTITYNSRSEISIPYGRLIPNSPTVEHNNTQLPAKNWARGKTGLAIWIVSNCGTTGWPRISYGKTLAKFMKIDIFGRCGKQCGGQCYERIHSYKFYIAFENNMCEDYITEKFWRNALQHDAVPIVYGAPKSDYERLAPKNSFIHISDFDNMSSLAAYIDSLDQNDTLYNRYFEWRLGYHAETFGMGVTAVSKDTLCAISKRLGNPESIDVNNPSNTEWFKKSCGDVHRPTMT